MTHQPRPGDDDLVERIRDLIPHHAFNISYSHEEKGTTVLTVRCRCGRTFDFFGYVDSDILIRWLVNHYDDLLLTPTQLGQKYEELGMTAPSRNDLFLRTALQRMIRRWLRLTAP